MADTKKPVAPSAAPELADPAQVPVPAAPPAVAITVAPNGTVTNQIGGGR